MKKPPSVIAAWQGLYVYHKSPHSFSFTAFIHFIGKPMQVFKVLLEMLPEYPRPPDGESYAFTFTLPCWIISLNLKRIELAENWIPHSDGAQFQQVSWAHLVLRHELYQTVPVHPLQWSIPTFSTQTLIQSPSRPLNCCSNDFLIWTMSHSHRDTTMRTNASSSVPRPFIAFCILNAKYAGLSRITCTAQHTSTYETIKNDTMHLSIMHTINKNHTPIIHPLITTQITINHLITTQLGDCYSLRIASVKC